MERSIFRLAFVILSMSAGFCSQAKTGRALIAENGLKPYVQPLLTTTWAQDGGNENAWLPIVDSAKGMLGKTGCGATALGQILKFWEYPKYGYSSNFYVWQSQVDATYEVRTVDFTESHYDWNNMLNNYVGTEMVTEKHRNAVAHLMSDIGVALEMKYKVKEDGTATQIEYIAMVLKKHFGYNPDLHLVLMGSGAYTMDEWLMMIYSELSEGRPVLMGGNGPTGARHLFVIDGYDAEGRVHCNMGHANDNENTYYDLTLPPTARNHYFLNMRMLVGICPQKLTFPIIEVDVSEPGSLLQALGGEKASKRVCKLKIRGPLNQTDFEVLRQLTISDVGQNISSIGQLYYIDLTEANLENETLPDAAFFADRDTPSFTLQTVKLPSSLKRIGRNAFRRCRCLYDIELPDGLVEIGSAAFFDCRALTELTIPASLKNLGASAFCYAKVDKFAIEKTNLYFFEKDGMILSADGVRLKACVSKEDGALNIPDGVRTIEANAFGGKAVLRKIVMPSTVKNIGANAFENCCGLTDIYVNATVPPSIDSTSFAPEYAKTVLHVPQGCKEAYEDNNIWSLFVNVVDDLLPDDTSVYMPKGASASFDTVGYGIDGRPVGDNNKKGIRIVRGKKYLKL